MRDNIRRTGLALLLAAAPLAGGHAQEPALLAGSYVRIPGLMTGTLTRVTADTLFMLTDAGANVALPRAALTTVEVSTPIDRAAGARRGALVGGGAGAVLGLVLWLSGTETETEHWNGTTTTGKSGPGDVALLGAFGVVFGGAYGAWVGRREWSSVRAGPAQVSLALLPGRRAGVRVMVR